MRHMFTRQNLLYIFLGLIACLILSFSFIHESQEQVYKRLGMIDPSPSTVRENKNSPRVPSHGNYILPHPGILPTNPVYSLKMIRDRIGLIVTTDPERRTRLFLHYANKRIAAAQMLADLGYIDKAVEVATKAESYLFQAISNSSQVSVQAQPIWFDTLKRATLKHEEVIEEIRLVSASSAKDQMNLLYKNLDQYRHQIVALSGQPFDYVRPEDLLLKPETASPSAQNIPYL